MTPRITVCGLGPGGPDRLNEATIQALEGADRVFLRTSRHPTADRVPGAATFDDLYERADSFDEIYEGIVDRLLTETDRHGHVVYAVPGSPLVLERSVRTLLRRAGGRADGGREGERARRSDGDVDAEVDVAVEVLPALSFLDEVWARLRVDPVDDGVRLIDGHRFAVQAADQRGPLLVAHAHAPWVLSDIKLAIDAGPEQRVVVLQGLGTPAEKIVELPWPELDRAIEPDHLTSLYVPEVTAPVGLELARSVEMMARLRRDCPWDRVQTHRSLRRFLLEEAYEVVDVIDRLAAAADDDDDDRALALSIELEEELGDLWFQILFHAELATEAGWFGLNDVARSLTDKMIGRHPHVYGDAEPAQAATIGGWEELKQAEKGRGSAMDDLPSALPALARADKALKRAERAGARADHGPLGVAVEAIFPDGTDGFDGSDGAVATGRLLLAVVDHARRRGINAEEALRQVTGRAVERFRAAESQGSVPADWVRG